VVPEGTGKMLDLIEQNAVDIAITVADGFIAGKGKGRNIQMCGTWVHSPLVWAIAGPSVSAPNNKKFTTFEELKDFKLNKNESIEFGISRMGSGSHTMAHYLAKLSAIPTASLDFEVLNDFPNLIKGNCLQLPILITLHKD
jgi:hypothetical protein